MEGYACPRREEKRICRVLCMTGCDDVVKDDVQGLGETPKDPRFGIL